MVTSISPHIDNFSYATGTRSIYLACELGAKEVYIIGHDLYDLNGTIENIYTNSRPIFGYFNFFGLTSSEFLGGVDWHRGLNPQSNISGKVPGAINLCLTKILNNFNTELYI